MKETYNRYTILDAIIITAGIPLYFLRDIAFGLINYLNTVRYFLEIVRLCQFVASWEVQQEVEAVSTGDFQCVE